MNFMVIYWLTRCAWTSRPLPLIFLWLLQILQIAPSQLEAGATVAVEDDPSTVVVAIFPTIVVVAPIFLLMLLPVPVLPAKFAGKSAILPFVATIDRSLFQISNLPLLHRPTTQHQPYRQRMFGIRTPVLYIMSLTSYSTSTYLVRNITARIRSE
jgi:hypothetical protein